MVRLPFGGGEGARVVPWTGTVKCSTRTELGREFPNEERPVQQGRNGANPTTQEQRRPQSDAPTTSRACNRNYGGGQAPYRRKEQDCSGFGTGTPTQGVWSLNDPNTQNVWFDHQGLSLGVPERRLPLQERAPLHRRLPLSSWSSKPPTRGSPTCLFSISDAKPAVQTRGPGVRSQFPVRY